ncbi:MaoC family dehydratase [Longispora fulva]|uniref:Acyl dehydratase n=1 Tax=Longispora fulva TaxID=619741 RepID=A0A8J7GZ89_9ACTN|nr:MaoC family dehydratase [Longispora fulva]MBG6141500.1 acyl dehydratase [Longispora fulva]GIG59350.1 MaoC family dehydratase [Longispora fulva]
MTAGPARRFGSLDELRAAAPVDLGHSDWVVVDQERIDRFAAATGDDQWIHVDPVRAADGPFGSTIAHGFLVLSLLPVITLDRLLVDRVRMAVNYGLNKVRFPAPVPVDSRLRGRVRVTEVTEVAGGTQVTCLVTVEREGGDRPVCVAESVARFYGEAP